MAMIRKTVPLQSAELADNRTRVTASTNQLARDGHIVEPGGLQTENFLRTGVILFDHDPKMPVGKPIAAQMNPDGSLSVEIEWAPPGISPKADEIRGLVKADVIRAVSIGFDPLDAEPLDPKRPKGGQHITRADLLECSFVSVPADTGAVVTQRSAEDWKCGASRDLPIEDSDAWDGPAAEASIFEMAGGDDFDPSKARKGFLAYNAAKPKERGSYKLPIAHVVDGRLKVPKGAIRAAASRLPQTDIPSEVKDSAEAVIKHYEEKAGMGEKDKSDRAVVAKHNRALERAPRVPVFKRGLCEVSNLAWLLGCLGYAHECSEWEEEVEADDSKVPAMLGEALKQLGDALIAMTQEEVQELLDAHDADDEEEIPEGERAYVSAGKTPRARAWRRGIAMVRAGRTLSASNEKKLNDASGHLDRANKHHKAIGEHHAAVAGHMDAITASQEKAQKSQADTSEALEAAKKEPEKADEHLARAAKANKAVGGHLADMAESQASAADRHADLADSNQAIGRSVKSAQRCMRSVVDGSSPGEDGDSKEVQTSAGTEESGGSSNDRSAMRQRRADLERLKNV